MENESQERREEGERPVGADHFVVETRGSTWWISTLMAKHIESCLDHDPRPIWIVFVDLAGSRIRIRSQDVESLSQSTAEQLSVHRELCHGWEREQKADRRWGDER